jgi:hypothetical protein
VGQSKLSFESGFCFSRVNCGGNNNNNNNNNKILATKLPKFPIRINGFEKYEEFLDIGLLREGGGVAFPCTKLIIR